MSAFAIQLTLLCSLVYSNLALTEDTEVRWWSITNQCMDDLHNFLHLGLDLAPVLEDGEGDVVSDAELDEV